MPADPRPEQAAHTPELFTPPTTAAGASTDASIGVSAGAPAALQDVRRADLSSAASSHVSTDVSLETRTDIQDKPPLPIRIEVSAHPADAVTIQLVGEIDIHDVDLIRAAAATAVAAKRPVVITCQDLTFMDSSALVLFVVLLRSRLSVTVVGLRPHLKKLLEVTGLDRLLHFPEH